MSAVQVMEKIEKQTWWVYFEGKSTLKRLGKPSSGLKDGETPRNKTAFLKLPFHWNIDYIEGIIKNEIQFILWKHAKHHDIYSKLFHYLKTTTYSYAMTKLVL